MKRSSNGRGERGSVTVLTVTVLSFAAILALVFVDLLRALESSVRAQTAADAAALAAAQEIVRPSGAQPSALAADYARRNGAKRWNGLGVASGKTLGVIDYTLAKRALLRDWHRGLLSRLEICDAHPELMRAARYLGAEAARPCPVCHDWDLRLLAYVFGDKMKTDNGRAFEIEEGLSRAASNSGAACYVIEVCTNCSWNHVCEAFMARSAG